MNANLKPILLGKNSTQELLSLIEHFRLTLEYIKSVATIECIDDVMEKRFVGIRNVAQDMLDEHQQADLLSEKFAG